VAEGRLYDVARRHRSALLSNERQAASEMVRVYGAIWQRLRGELLVLLEEMAQAQSEGEAIDAAWLYRQARYETLIRQAEAELRWFAQYASEQVRQEQAAAVQAATANAEEQVRTILNKAGISTSWVQLPTDVLEDLVGFTANGSPLWELLETFGATAAKNIREALLEGVAQGWNPERTAAKVRQFFGGDLVRALRVSRTETLRAYREATLRSYQANDDVVDGWIWNAACTPRTCAMCYAMHGTLHPLTERLNDHPNGRCSMLPHVKSLPGMTEQWQPEPGPDQFDRLDPGAQKAILGPLYDLYKSGEIKLSDVVAQKFDSDWGSMRYVKSLASLLKGRA
jgi:SPP1 gp7 family putative phage head morphogenesis protein